MNGLSHLRRTTVSVCTHSRPRRYVRNRARELAIALFGEDPKSGGPRPYLAVHVRREHQTIGCKRGEPSVLCPKPGAKFTINTSAVAARIARERERHGLAHVYIATVYPARLSKYARELDMLLAAVPGALSLSNATSMATALGCASRRCARMPDAIAIGRPSGAFPCVFHGVCFMRQVHRGPQAGAAHQAVHAIVARAADLRQREVLPRDTGRRHVETF